MGTPAPIRSYAGPVKPPARLVLAALLLALAALAGAGSKPPKKDAQMEPREAQLIAALPEDDRRWLTEYVAPIILPDEKNAYLELTETYQREDFREKKTWPLGSV